MVVSARPIFAVTHTSITVAVSQGLASKVRQTVIFSLLMKEEMNAKAKLKYILFSSSITTKVKPKAKLTLKAKLHMVDVQNRIFGEIIIGDTLLGDGVTKVFRYGAQKTFFAFGGGASTSISVACTSIGVSIAVCQAIASTVASTSIKVAGIDVVVTPNSAVYDVNISFKATASTSIEAGIDVGLGPPSSLFSYYSNHRLWGCREIHREIHSSTLEPIMIVAIVPSVIFSSLVKAEANTKAKLKLILTSSSVKNIKENAKAKLKLILLSSSVNNKENDLTSLTETNKKNDVTSLMEIYSKIQVHTSLLTIIFLSEITLLAKSETEKDLQSLKILSRSKIITPTVKPSHLHFKLMKEWINVTSSNAIIRKMMYKIRKDKQQKNEKLVRIARPTLGLGPPASSFPITPIKDCGSVEKYIHRCWERS